MFACLFFLLLGLCWSPAAALSQTSSISIMQGFNFFNGIEQPFGFQAGGAFSLRFSEFGNPTPDFPMHLLYCNEAEVKKLSDDDLKLSCGGGPANATYDFCSFGATLKSSDAVEINGTIITEGLYGLWIYSCIGSGGRVSLLQVNQNGNHLSLNQLNIPMVYAVMIVLWGILILLWFANWIWFRKVRIVLHLTLTLVLVTKLICMVAVFLSWYFLSLYGNLWSPMKALRIIFIFIFQEIFLLTLALIGKGWCVIRRALTPHENRVSLAISLATALGLLFFLIFQSYLLVVVIVMYVLFVRYIYLNANTIIYNVDMMITLLQETPTFPFLPNAPTPPSTVAQEYSLRNKLYLTRIFQRSLGLYVFFVVVGIIGNRFFFAGQGWVETMMLEAFDFLFCCSLAHIFRLRDFEVVDVPHVAVQNNEAVQDENFPKHPDFLVIELPRSEGKKPIRKLAIRI